MVKVFVSGCFDFLHIGHLNFLEFAKNQGDYLIVSVASDETIKTYKKREPVFHEDERAYLISAIKYVDEVFVNRSDPSLTWEDFKSYASFMLKKGDYLVIPEDDKYKDEKQQYCDEHDFILVTRPIVKFEPHTTTILERIRK